MFLSSLSCQSYGTIRTVTRVLGAWGHCIGIDFIPSHLRLPEACRFRGFLGCLTKLAEFLSVIGFLTRPKARPQNSKYTEKHIILQFIPSLSTQHRNIQLSNLDRRRPGLTPKLHS